MRNPTHRPRSRVAATCAATAVLAGLGTALTPALTPAVAAPGTTSAPHVATVTGGGYVPVPSLRAMDTRTGLGLPHSGKVGAGQKATVLLAGRAGVPAAGGATAVVVNLTETNASTASFLSAYPSDVGLPTASSLNFPANVTRANLVTVPLHADGKITIYNALGATDVIVDVVGYYAAAEDATHGGLQPTQPDRFDSRLDKMRFGDTGGLDLGYDYGPLNPDITAFVATITVDKPTSVGYLTTGASGEPTPNTSSLNFANGANASNLAIIKRGNTFLPDGTTVVPSLHVGVTTSGGDVSLIVDVVGVFTTPGASEDGRFVPLPSPRRVIDTRATATGGPNLRPGEDRGLGTGPVGTAATIALAANLTVAKPTSPTFLTTYASDETRPQSSSLNAARGDSVANGAVLTLGLAPRPSATAFRVFNGAGTTPLIIDVAGTYEPFTPLGLTKPSAAAWSHPVVHAVATPGR